jgi:hypothetical protein
MIGTPDRSGLLSDIGNFRKGGLKKAVTNDRSAPMVGGSSNNNNNNTRNSTTNRSNINERPSTTPLITPNQLNATMLKSSGTGGSNIKVKKPSIPQFAPPPPVNQPVVKTPPADQTRHFPHQGPRLPPREPPPPPPNETKPKLGQLTSSIGLFSSFFSPSTYVFLFSFSTKNYSCTTASTTSSIFFDE